MQQACGQRMTVYFLSFPRVGTVYVRYNYLTWVKQQKLLSEVQEILSLTKETNNKKHDTYLT